MYNKTLKIKRVAASVLMTATLSWLALSCQKQPQTMKFVSLPESGWTAGHVLHFPVDSLLPTGTYEAYIGIRTSSAITYPYRQLVLEVAETLGDGIRKTDTLQCEMAESDGEEKGQGVSLYTMEFPLGLVFVNADSVNVFSVRHLMRHTPLPGITDVGIIFRP